MTTVAVMYHYVRSHSQDLPFFKYLPRESFIAQVRFLKEVYGILSADDFTDWARGPRRTPLPSGALLTFDDGLRDHFDIVAPILEDEGIRAIFYVPTGMWAEQRMLEVHRAHLLLGRLGGTRAWLILKSIIKPNMLKKNIRHEFYSRTYERQLSSDESTKLFKRYINYFIDYSWQADVLNQVFLRSSIGQDDWDFWCANFYMTKSMIVELTHLGHIIGGHSVSHKLFSELSVKDQCIEISQCLYDLKMTTSKLVETFCYPYGGHHSFTKDTESLLHLNNILYTFNVEARNVTLQDFCFRPQALPRFDCNTFLFGSVNK